MDRRHAVRADAWSGGEQQATGVVITGSGAGVGVGHLTDPGRGESILHPPAAPSHDEVREPVDVGAVIVVTRPDHIPHHRLAVGVHQLVQFADQPGDFVVHLVGPHPALRLPAQEVEADARLGLVVRLLEPAAVRRLSRGTPAEDLLVVGPPDVVGQRLQRPSERAGPSVEPGQSLDPTTGSIEATGGLEAEEDLVQEEGRIGVGAHAVAGQDQDPRASSPRPSRIRPSSRSTAR